MKAPSDTVLRERLDAVSPSLLRGAFRRALHLLQRGKGLEDFIWWAGHYLLSVDGTSKNVGFSACIPAFICFNLFGVNSPQLAANEK